MTAIDHANLREAQAGLVGVAEATPLIQVPIHLGHPAAPARLKAEFLQPIGTFKIRGSWTAIRRLDPAIRARGVVTSSSGNHGLGLAYGARRLGVPAVVVVPESTPRIKVDGIRRSGGEVVFAGKTRGPAQFARAEQLARERDLTLIPAFDHPDVIAGQGTCGLEILEQWPEVDTIVVPVGGGGLLAGVCSAVRATGARVRIVAAEPLGIPKLSLALTAGHPVEVDSNSRSGVHRDSPGSVADGLLTPRIGTLTWPLIRDCLEAIVSVSDAQIRDAMRWLARHGIRVEPSGAVSVAAVLSGGYAMSGPTAMISTGANVDRARFEELIGA